MMLKGYFELFLVIHNNLLHICVVQNADPKPSTPAEQGKTDSSPMASSQSVEAKKLPSLMQVRIYIEFLL